ncbi:MAG TPA: hypothetical protein DDY20_12785 [Desulfobulbaceae bacterium]|nr:hypothetical protein [Desulfobulbaceae bacterium]
MININEALKIIKDHIPKLAVHECALHDAIGRTLAEDVLALEPSPRYTNSAMDGYGVCWEDVCRAAPESPAALAIVGESQAGIPFTGIVGEGEAIRINTGAMLAAGCDTIIRSEDTEEKNNVVSILTVKKKGQDVRVRGEEFQIGDLLLQKRTKISAPQAALLASLGISKIRVYTPCKVAVLVTGSELVAADETIADHQIRDSNMIMLEAAILETGGMLAASLRISDNEEATRQAIERTKADIIICTGGVSVGRHDHVKEAAVANGFSPLFWQIRQKPGKPLFFAKKGSTLLFGLPGNPVSAFMCFTHYVRPVISALNGLPFGWPTVSGEVEADTTNKGKRANMIRVQLTWRPNGGYYISHVEKQGSYMLTSLSDTDGYIIVGPGQTLKAGTRIDVYRYDFRRDPV